MPWLGEFFISRPPRRQIFFKIFLFINGEVVITGGCMVPKLKIFFYFFNCKGGDFLL